MLAALPCPVVVSSELRVSLYAHFSFKLVPQTSKLSRKRRSKGRLPMVDDQILLIARGGLCGPIEGAVEQGGVAVDHAELVVHRVERAVRANWYAGCKQSRRVCPSTLGLLVVGDDAHAQAPLMLHQQLVHQPVVREREHGNVDAVVGCRELVHNHRHVGAAQLREEAHSRVAFEGGSRRAAGLARAERDPQPLKLRRKALRERWALAEDEIFMVTLYSSTCPWGGASGGGTGFTGQTHEAAQEADELGEW